MRILFIDFDGVLHPGPNVATSLTHFCWVPVLTRLLAPWADVEIVIHSTWRHQYELSELREMLGMLGRRVIAVTSGAHRWSSIQEWVALNPRTTSYRVLDDEPDEFPRPAPNELVICQPDLGVAEPEVQARLRTWLAS